MERFFERGTEGFTFKNIFKISNTDRLIALIVPMLKPAIAEPKMTSDLSGATMDETLELINSLHAAIGLLEMTQDDPLRQDILLLCDYLTQPNVRIAVFAPFNYGKSTLLNAMLGERALPIDLIPTTGAAIVVRYGHELQTSMRLVDGTEICEAGTDLLKRFAILDEHRRMREDVASIEVLCPHPFLQTGVEFLDLPGTDDEVAQNTLVKQQLLTADLVIQVLDARKLMTLQEREHLRDWLLDRGIDTVIFVVNFVNLLEPEAQKQVLHRLRFVAESFRSALSPGMSNLYRVDALPALRARLKGEITSAQLTGLPTFESDLQSIVQTQRTQLNESRRQRSQLLIQPLKLALQQKKQAISTEIETIFQKHHRRIEIRQKAHALIQQGFLDSVTTLRAWLSLPNLVEHYSTEATLALQRTDFQQWETKIFKPDWFAQRRDLIAWVDRACDFFNIARPADLHIAFPTLSDSPPPPVSPVPKPGVGSTVDGTDVAIATGLGWMLGGPVGAAVLGGASYLLKQNQKDRTIADISKAPTEQFYAETVKDYLTQFSTNALTALAQYEIEVKQAVSVELNAIPIEPPQQYQLKLLEAVLANLEQFSA